jgi:hypothetical protein
MNRHGDHAQNEEEGAKKISYLYASETICEFWDLEVHLTLFLFGKCKAIG